MAAVSRPVAYGSLLVLAAASLWATSSEPAKSAKARSSKTASSRPKPEDWVFPAEEAKLRFPAPATKVRDVFKALVASERLAVASEEEELVAIPSDFAGGESGWAYTGMVEVDGAKLALLENTSTHVGGYVREGEAWKKCRVVGISVPFLVLEGPDGLQRTIHRYNPNAPPKPKPAPESGFKPLDLGPALQGPIGLEIKPTQPQPQAKPAPSLEVQEVKR